MHEKLKRSGRYAIFYLMAIALGAAILAGALSKAREAARESACRGMLCQLSMALLYHYEATRGFPPRFGSRADGSRATSRELIIYSSFSWDRSLNANSIDRDFYCCPNNSSGDPDYLIVAGPETIIQDEKALGAADVVDGVENTVIIVEAADLSSSAVHGEIQLSDLSKMVDHNGCIPATVTHPLGRGLLFADGLIFRLIKPLPASSMRALMTIAGNEKDTREKLIAAGYLVAAGGWKHIPFQDAKTADPDGQ